MLFRSDSCEVQEEMKSHFGKMGAPGGCDIEDPNGSVTDLPPDTDEAGSRRLYDQHAQGQTAGQPKPVDSVASRFPGPNANDLKHHPGPKLKSEEIKNYLFGVMVVRVVNFYTLQMRPEELSWQLNFTMNLILLI